MVSNALRYCAGSLCFMAIGMNLTALMKGISSLTAQLEMNSFSKISFENSGTKSHTDASLQY